MDRLVIGCGYLGQRVARAWRALGCRVHVTTRSAARAGELRALDLEPVICNVLDGASLEALPRCQTALFCVGADRSAGASLRQVHVDGLANVLTALARTPRLIYVSSTGVYGQCAGEDVDEHSATDPVEESGMVMRDAEELLRERPGAVALRFAGIYGPGRLLRQRGLLAGEPIVGDPDKWLNLIHVDDGAAAVLRADDLSPLQYPVYNVCDDEPVRRRDFYECLAALLGAPPPRFGPSPEGAPPAPHDHANRRVKNDRLRRELGITLTYSNYRIGLPASLAGRRSVP